MEFRITVYLNHFFADYRSSCRLFISKQIKTVEDLLRHIAKMFHINSKFCLLHNGLYLPDREDVRVLQDNDTVIAIPYVDDGCVNPFNMKTFSPLPIITKTPENVFTANLNSEYPMRKRKKRTQIELEPIKKSTNLNVQEDIEMKSALSNDNKLAVINEESKSESNLEKTKKESNNIQGENVEEVSKFKMGTDKKHSKTLNIISQKHIELLPISTSPNIVKSVRVYDSPSVVDDDFYCKQREPEISLNCAEDKAVLTSDALLSSKDNIIESEQKSNSIETYAETSTEISDMHKVKRKRKRVRKRKNVKNVEVISELHETEVVSKSSDTKPTLHIRFNNEESEIVNIKTEKINYEKLCADEIITFPIMTDIFPKVGDVIAFKVYVLTQNYTPEISNYIIGQVKKYCSDTTIVIFTILEGGDQCRIPEGKLFIGEIDNNNDVEKQAEYKWQELLEPRLLFP